MARVEGGSAARIEPHPDEFTLPPELAGAPLYAQMLWTLQRRQETALGHLQEAIVGAAQVNKQAYDELAGAIGSPGDENGLGARGVAGEVGAIKRLIGREPVEGVHPGTGILGRLAKHDQNRTWWDNRVREARGAVAVLAMAGTVVWFLVGDQIKHLFAAGSKASGN